MVSTGERRIADRAALGTPAPAIPAVLLAALIIIPTTLATLTAVAAAEAPPQRPANTSATPVPAGYRHRPSIEFFTGLSCPSCMGGPHPDMERIWEEGGYDPEQAFTYVVFHELNGGGVDDLNSEEATERMRHYQPGISGTPDAEFDGGYIELGGMYGGTLNYQTAKQAIKDCEARASASLNPLHPIQSLRSGFKYVRLGVRQLFDGTGFAVMVRAEYLGTSALIETKALNGILYVFMVEDNVTAFSKVEGKSVLNHNVFRGYAIKGESFTLRPGESRDFTGRWEVPKNLKVPVKPGDVSAVAVVYDADDTSSESGNQGNPNRVPRAVQSATPLSTAYDEQNDLPVARGLRLSASGGGVILTAELDDADGIAAGYVLYNTEGSNATNWSIASLNLTGEECSGGTCAAYKNARGTAFLKASPAENFFIVLLLYDGNGTQGRVELANLTAAGAGPGAGGGGGLQWMAGGSVLLLAVAAVFFFWKKGLLAPRSGRQKT
ncbi:MAG: hypothetical protein QW379_08240 [Thermoplasmata archaeon]